MNNIFLISTILFLLFPFQIIAQNNSDSLYPFRTEPAIYTLKKEHVDITLNNGEIQIESKSETEKLLQSTKGDSWTDEYIFYSSFVEISDINAELLIPHKKKFKSVPPTNMLLQERYNGGSFYDDGKIQKLIFPKSPINSKIHVSYKEKFKTSDIFGAYFFSSYIPVLYSEYSVSFPEEIQLNYKLYNGDKSKIKFTETKKKKITTYTWSTENINSFRNEYKDFSINYYEPHLMLSIKSVNNVPFLITYNDLYKKYIQLLNNPYPEIDPVFKAIVDSLCKNKTTEIEKLESIYYFVQSKIQYIAFEDGYAGLIPEKPLVVYNRKFGDCKGKSNLLATLLRQANIKAWITWVGTRKKPYKYSEFPTAFVDDHMIVTAQINGKDFSLDATDIFLHYSFPSQFTQGKESLVGIDSTTCRIFEIPTVPFEKNLFRDELVLTINHDTLQGSGKAALTGYYKNDLTVELIRHTENKNSDTYKKWFCKKQEKAKLDTAYAKNVDNRLDTLFISYKMTLPGYVKKYEDNIYINLNLEMKYQNKTIDTASFVYNKYLDYAYIETLNYKLVIPDGYTIESIPDNSTSKFENFCFMVTYHKTDKYITMNQEIYVKQPFIEVIDFQKWNQMIKEICKTYNQTISLKRKNNENKK